MQVLVGLPWRRASGHGIKVDIPRTLTKRSHVLPLPKGEGGVRGKEFSILHRVRNPSSHSSVSTENSEEPLWQSAAWPLSFAWLKAGRSMPAKIAMTTSSSITVKLIVLEERFANLVFARGLASG